MSQDFKNATFSTAFVKVRKGVGSVITPQYSVLFAKCPVCLNYLFHPSTLFWLSQYSFETLYHAITGSPKLGLPPHFWSIFINLTNLSDTRLS